MAIAISIHAPLRERQYSIAIKFNAIKFQSTLPCGSDFCALVGFLLMSDFNLRSLAGATFTSYLVNAMNINFNPRSLAGATYRERMKYSIVAISIHAPLRERLFWTFFEEV